MPDSGGGIGGLHGGCFGFCIDHVLANPGEGDIPQPLADFTGGACHVQLLAGHLAVDLLGSGALSQLIGTSAAQLSAVYQHVDAGGLPLYRGALQALLLQHPGDGVVDGALLAALLR